VLSCVCFAGNPWKEGAENLIFGAIGAGIAFCVGIIFNVASGRNTIS